MTEQEFRIEHDTMGEVKVPVNALWRAQTQRAVENFPISGRGLESAQIRAMGLLKAACAQVNKDRGLLDAAKADAIIAAARKWGKEKEFGYTVGCENGQIWLTLKPFLERRMREERLFFPIEVMKPLTDKMVRARPLQGRMQQGRVWFKKDASWAPEMETELLRFPSGVHDDIVDALAWSAHLALSMEPPRVPQKPREKSWKDKLFSLTHEGSFMSA